MRYEERPAPSSLERWVNRTWYLEAPPLRRYEKILPLPYVHVIVDLSEPYRLRTEDGWQVVDGAFCSGVQPRYLVIENPPQIVNAGVELTVDGLRAFTHLAPADVTGRVQDASVVIPAAAGLAAAARGAREAGGADAVLDTLEELVRAALRPEVRPDPLVERILAAIHADDAGLPHAQLAAGLGVSHRTFIARFRAACGLTPKAYADVWRFHRLVTTLPVGGDMPSWADVAAGARYYDQPHFIHAFRRFTGVTPTTYLRQVAQFGPDAATFVPLDEPGP